MTTQHAGRRKRSTRKGGRGAATFMLETVGEGNTQWDNVFMSDRSKFHGNAIVGLQGQHAGKRRRTTKRKLKGGYWGMISKAMAPFSLKGTSFRRKTRGGTRKKR